MIEAEVTLYLDTDEESVHNAKLAQVLKYARELGFQDRYEVIFEDEIDLPEGHMYTPRIGKVKRFIRELHFGLENKYPICCILRFAFECTLMEGKILPCEQGPAEKRGGFYRGPFEDDDVFVPCNIFHHRNDAGFDEWWESQEKHSL
jgi:hypothetical protein